MSRCATLVAVLGCLLVPSIGAAQDLARVESLALSGQAEEARAVLTTWWEGNFDDATRIDRQKGLWLRGLLTVDPDLAELDFQRLVVEYPGGPFTAEAIVRLGGSAEARGEFAKAEGHFATLLRDYPGSRYQTLAQAWLDSHDTTHIDAPSVGRPATSTPPAEVTTPPPPHAFAVQLGAFSSEARARTLSQAASAAGLVIRVVRVEGNSLFRVRVGKFSTEEEAKAQIAQVLALGFEATIVSNADREGA